MSDPNAAPPDATGGEPVTVVIGPAPFNAAAGIAALLASANLPVPDEDDAPVQMMAAFAGPHLVGCVGWEQYGNQALLRSLAVPEAVRGEGVGTALVAALVAVLKGIGIADVWLLTTDAAAWFERADFTPVTREDVPESVRASREFGLGCCATARAMHRRLAG
jgi:amino-acid N-acetyltransferase